MIAIKVNGKPHNIPENYEELTFAMWCDIIEARQAADYDKIISIFTGLPVEEIKGARIQGLEIILKKMKFLQKEPLMDEKPIKLGPYTFPENIAYETTEQYQETLKEINRVTALNDVAESNRALALYAAIYCCDPFSIDRAKKLAETFMNLPCMEVMAAGSFFMARSQSLQTDLSMSFLRRNILMKKKRPVLKRLLKRLGFMLHLTTSRDM